MFFQVYLLNFLSIPSRRKTIDDRRKFLEDSLRRRANARNVSTSFLPYGGITYFINSFDYPNLLCFNSPPTQHQFL